MLYMTLGKNVLVCGDNVSAMSLFPDESVHFTPTSPPYFNAVDYGDGDFPSYDAYLEFLGEVFAQVHRMTKEGRFLAVNTSPVIVPRAKRSESSKRYAIPFDLHSILVRSGWDFIEDILWVKPSGSAKNRNGGFFQHRKPLAYKPNLISEYVLIYRKHTKKLIDWNMRQYPSEIVQASLITGEYEQNNVWHISPASHPNHDAVFPLGLCERLIRYYSYVGDVIFDPFAGSGTTCEVANDLDRRFVAIEKQPRFIPDILDRFSL